MSLIADRATDVPLADSFRRAHNVQLISRALAGLLAVLFCYTLVSSAGLITLGLLGLGAIAMLLIGGWSQPERVDTAARALVATLLLIVACETISRARFGISPFYFAGVLAISGAVLRPREALAAFAIGVALILALWLGLGEPALAGVQPGSLLLVTLAVSAMAGLASILNTNGIIAALRAAEQGDVSAQMFKDALRESENYYQLIADHTRDLIALLDSDGLFLYASPSYTRALGYASVEIIGKGALDILHPDDRPRALGDFQRASTSGQAQGAYRVVGSDGSVRWLSIRFSLARDAEAAYTIIVAQDITEQILLESQLQQARKLESLGLLAGSVAHDFNNLLAVIGGSATLASETLDRQHPAYADLLQVLDATQRAGALTRQLLTFARRHEYQPQQVDLGDVVRNIEALIARLIGRGIALELVIGDDLPPVLADPSQIEQVVMNLAANARDAMPQGGTLRIGVEQTTHEPLGHLENDQLPAGRYVCLSVSDTGVGMSEDVQRRIFEPFFTTKGPERGTGLGLATCYGIITQSRGRIEVQSVVGAGTTFRVLLPATAEVQRPQVLAG